jgi:hypothetical protein
MINETLAAHLEEILARGVLRALREADMMQQATAVPLDSELAARL